MTDPIIFIEELIADQHQIRALAHEIVRRMPQMIETKVSAANKKITNEVRKELGWLK